MAKKDINGVRLQTYSMNQITKKGLTAFSDRLGRARQYNDCLSFEDWQSWHPRLHNEVVLYPFLNNVLLALTLPIQATNPVQQAQSKLRRGSLRLSRSLSGAEASGGLFFVSHLRTRYIIAIHLTPYNKPLS